MELAIHVEHCAARFARTHRYTLGGELHSYGHQTLRAIAAANSTRDRSTQLFELRLILERINVHLDLAREVQTCDASAAIPRSGRQIAPAAGEAGARHAPFFRQSHDSR